MIDSGDIRPPVERRNELNEIKTKLEEFNNLKSQQVFFGKRDRIFKGGWRHGVLGVDDADSNTTSVFYKDTHQQKVKEQEEKQIINSRRLQKLKLGTATTEQIEFGSTEQPRRSTTIHKQPEPVVDILHVWKTKGRTPCSHAITIEATKERVFLAQDKQESIIDPTIRHTKKPPMANIERTEKLRNEEQRGRRYNIINGQYEGHEKWKRSLAKDSFASSQTVI